MTDGNQAKCGNEHECKAGIGFRQEDRDHEQDDRDDLYARVEFMDDTFTGKVLSESDIGEHNYERFLSGSDIYTFYNIVYHTFSKYPRLFFKYLSIGTGFYLSRQAGVLFMRFAKPRSSLLGRAKNCQWQVFVRPRLPKQGELRTDVSKATMFQGEREQKHARRAAPTPLLSCFFKSR